MDEYFRKIGGMRIRQICASERIIFSFDSKVKHKAEQFIRTVPKYKQALPPVIDVELRQQKIIRLSVKMLRKSWRS